MTEDAPRPLDTITGVPIVSYGALIGHGEIKDGVLSIELQEKVAKDFVDYVRMGLINGLNITPVYIEATISTFEAHPVEMENNNG